jgi:hypothetical protein
MKNPANKGDYFDEHQEEICKLCEDLIIGGCSMTSTFLCEGRFCDSALDMFIEEHDETRKEGVSNAD